MKLLVLFAVLATTCAAPQNQQDVQVLRYDVDNGGLGSYNFAYELSDGSKHEEQGELRNRGTENEAISVRGEYTWISPEGNVYTITYIADENGFQPQVSEGRADRASQRS